MTVRYRLPLTDGDDRELAAARLWVLGAIGIQELPDALIAWFDHRVRDVPPGGRWDAEPERDWLAGWRDGLTPVRAGRIAVVPTWLVDEHDPTPQETTIVLDPGVAFGSGHHETTRLCLELLQEVVRVDDHVLDVGCGTGILAIAAALLGAGEVEAVDVDADAVVATRRNAAANDVTVTVRAGSVDSATRPADVTLANLLTPTLHTLADQLVAATRPGGALIASGVGVDRAPGVIEALQRSGASLVERRDRGEWSALLLRTKEGT